MRFENRTTSNSPDIEFTASVRTRELHFDAVTDPKVRFSGYPERDSDWLSSRVNLPEKAREGVVYRNAEVRLLIASEITESRSELSNSTHIERAKTTSEHLQQKTEEQQRPEIEEEK